MEIEADVILKATKVDGVYTADPKLDPTAVKFDHLGYMEVLNRGIEVMDNTALTLCMDNDVPIVVFNLLEPGNIERVVLGEKIGTLVGSGRSLVIDPVLRDAETKMAKSVEHFNTELTSIRTGRANPALIDRVMVPYYGTPDPLNQLAQISAPEAATAGRAGLRQEPDRGDRESAALWRPGSEPGQRRPGHPRADPTAHGGATARVREVGAR